MVGGVLLPVTVSKNVSVVLFGPSLTMTEMVEVPFTLLAGVTVTVRFGPEPPKTMLLVGTSDGLDEPPRNCRFAAATCASLIARHWWPWLPTGTATDGVLSP